MGMTHIGSEMSEMTTAVTISERAALIMLTAWRGATVAATRAKYRPALYDDERQRVRSTSAETRPAAQPGTATVQHNASTGPTRR